MTDFSSVHKALAKALAERGYSEPTAVQAAMLERADDASDLLVSAETGSGKTVAFGIALASQLLGKRPSLGATGRPQALIIAPTRELALQVKTELAWLFQEAGAVIQTCVGGMDMRREIKGLDRGCHMVVGTPGRLKDHIERGSLDLDTVKVVVLDEADEMLDLGFRDELEFILSHAPEKRRTLLFSATISKPIAELAKTYQRDAERVAVRSATRQHSDIQYRALPVARGDEENAIVNILRYYEAGNAIVFCATRAAVAHLTARLTNRGFGTVALSGELSQKERSNALLAMRDGRARVCVATDVAARGIDLPGLDLVIHADLPRTAETLLHRSGRTGRAGRKGISAIIVPGNRRRTAERLLATARLQAQWVAPPTPDDILEQDRQRLSEYHGLHAPLEDYEKLSAAGLLERFDAEMVAAAFLRLYFKDKSPGEDLRPVDMNANYKDKSRKPARRSFKDGPKPKQGQKSRDGYKSKEGQNPKERYKTKEGAKAKGDKWSDRRDWQDGDKPEKKPRKGKKQRSGRPAAGHRGSAARKKPGKT